MMKVKDGFFSNEMGVEQYYTDLFIKAAKALGCVTDDEIRDGVECLKRIARIETKYTFDDVWKS